MRDFDSSRRLRLHLIGPVRVTSRDEEDLTPQLGSKLIGLLVVLALSPDYRRSRAALAEKLWGSTGDPQAGNSFRKNLQRLRAILGEDSAVLLIDKKTVALESKLVWVDISETPPATLRQKWKGEWPLLVEGLNIRGEREFDDWLAMQQSVFEDRLDNPDDEIPPPAPVVDESLLQPGLQLQPEKPWLRILAPQIDSGSSGAFLSHLVSAAIARSIQERGSIDVTDEPHVQVGLDLRVEVLKSRAGTSINVTLYGAPNRLQLWSATRSFKTESFVSESEDLLHLVNEGVEVAMQRLHHLLRGPHSTDAMALGFSAVEKMFSGRAQALAEADVLLSEANARDSRGIYDAWRSYLRTFYQGEQSRSDVYALKLEAEEFARRAIEADPSNSMALALAGYVNAFVLRRYEIAHEFAERGLRYNPYNALAAGFLGRIKSYLGDHEEGYRLARKARAICGPASFRFTLDFLGGMTALLSGNREEAIRLGEIATSEAPEYLPPQRYLLPLYVQTGAVEKARMIHANLCRLEPGFSINRMREQQYPNTGILEAGLLNFTEADF